MNDESIRKWLYGSSQGECEMKKNKRIYIATPVNARTEKTLEEKRKAAYYRCETLKMLLREEMGDDVRFCTSFDICPLGITLSEESIMGGCVSLVMKCDAIYLDHGWTGSKGCNLEYRTAKIYGKEIMEYDKM